MLEKDNWQVCARAHAGNAEINIEGHDEWNWFPAALPFDAISWLHGSGLGDDPMVGQNNLKYRWAEGVDWVLRKEFSVEPDTVNLDDELQLVLNELDCYCDVFLNGVFLGRTASQFREHQLDVETLHLDKPNELVLYIRSAKHVNSLLESAYGQLPAGFDSGRVHARRCQALTGWDFAPRLSSVSFLCEPVIRTVQPIYVSQPHIYTSQIAPVDFGQDQAATAQIQGMVDVVSRRRGQGELAWEISEIATGRVVASKSEQIWIKSRPQKLKTTFELSEPQLWWSNGVGEQPLYQATVSLKADDRLGNRHESSESFTFGIRTLTISRQYDEAGESFTPLLNGHPVFCRGANWLPVNLLLSRVKPEDYRRLISTALGAGINCLRVWGGGVYERDEFYELCNRAGILVWQDFMFACAAYPVYRGFLDEVEAEAAYQVRRLRNHPCLMVWCGNDENEWLHQRGNLKKGNEQKIIGETIWAHVLNDVVEDHDPSRVYHQSSPFGRDRSDYNDMGSGDRHSWEVWADWAPVESYLEDKGRFVTEFGIQSLPSMETLDDFHSSPAQPSLTDPAIANRQYMEGGMERLISYTAAHFALPNALEEWVKTTQELQADVLGRAVEHWRRNRSVTMGALIWHLNEPYPGITWSLVDFNGRPKVALGAALRFFAPVLLSMEILVADRGVYAVPPQIWPEYQPNVNPAIPLANDEGFTCVTPEPTVLCRLYVINSTGLRLTGRVRGGFYRGEDEVETLAAILVESAPNGTQVVLTHVLDSSLMAKIRELELRAEFYLDEESRDRLEWLEGKARARQLEILGGEDEAGSGDLREGAVSTLPVSYMQGLKVTARMVEPKHVVPV